MSGRLQNTRTKRTKNGEKADFGTLGTPIFNSREYEENNPLKDHKMEHRLIESEISVPSVPPSTISRITAAAATSRPDLFSGVYWGCFTLSKNPEISATIIENRNEFARAWRLKRRSRAYIPRPRLKPYEDLDHLELFRDEDEALVMICSNYGGTPPPLALGMQRIPPIYSDGVESFAVLCPTLRELRAKMKACDETPKVGLVAT